jgi:hypothetical protein
MLTTLLCLHREKSTTTQRTAEVVLNAAPRQGVGKGFGRAFNCVTTRLGILFEFEQDECGPMDGWMDGSLMLDRELEMSCLQVKEGVLLSAFLYFDGTTWFKP